jgi:AcrR family transcriptional regulator
MARPIEFDPNEAISAAIEVFAERGYEGSSTTELLSRMGIARQSLYCAFGDKRQLFLKALERYNSASIDEFVAALRSNGDRLEALEAALLSFAGREFAAEAGCLGVVSIAEFGRSDPDINAINDESARRLLTALSEHVAAAVTAEEMRDVDPQEAARLLLVVRAGLKVAARGGASLDELRATARMALRSLRA